jgi:TFIIF-interacting CTD phosphatase-like protein
MQKTLITRNRGLLIFDLDETLVHTSYSPISGIDFCSRRGLFYLYERPHLREFLARCVIEFDLAIWSASKAEYVRWVIKSTVLRHHKFIFVNTRRNCKRILGKHGNIEYQKDFTPYLLNYEKVVMLDDFPKMVFPIKCCIKAPEYRGGNDDFLLRLSYQSL